MDDLRPELRPQLVEIGWQGKLADVATAEGIQQIGFPVNYPEGATRRDTQSAATVWHDNGWEGVVCRSASMHRLRYSDWSGSPDRWSELAIFTQRVKQPPKLLRRIFGHGWMNV